MSELSQRLLASRTINLLGFLGCVLAMLGALYLQYAEDLEPCPLCVFQRVGVIAAGLFFLLAALHNPGSAGQRTYGILAGLGAIGGGIVAARHIWLQNLPADEVPACGPGLDYMLDVFPMRDVLSMVFSGSGECAEIDWTFLGITIPQMALLTFLGLLALALFQVFRRYR